MLTTESLAFVSDSLSIHFAADGHEHAEGESLSLSHQHNAFIPAERNQSSGLTGLGTFSGTSTSDGSNLALSLVSTSALFSTHLQHNSPAFNAAESSSASIQHVSHVSAASIGAGSSATSPEHGHPVSAAAAGGAATPGASVAGGEVSVTGPSAAVESKLQSGPHDRHAVSLIKTEISSKAAPKRCTTTYTGKQLAVTIDGNRRCDCEAKQKVAEEQAKKTVGEEGPRPGSPLLVAKTNCVPCQGNTLPGLTGVFEICTAPPGTEMEAPIPGLEFVAPGLCPERGAESADENETTAGGWLEHAHILGWSMIAGSIAVLPGLRQKRNDKDWYTEDEEVPAVDWLFGRLGIELLGR